MRTLITSLGFASIAAALMAPEGLGLGLEADSNNGSYIVHKEGEAAILELSKSGRVVTEGFNKPEWAGQVVLAVLHERNEFYSKRLGGELAEPLLNTNVINFDDLCWVALDAEGEEVELIADVEFRNNVLASVLGVDRETGDIDGAVAEHYIERDNAGYTLQDIASKQDIDEVFGNGEQKAEANG